MGFQKTSTVSDERGRARSQKNWVKTKFQQANAFSKKLRENEVP